MLDSSGKALSLIGRNFPLAEIVERILEDAKADLHVALPGRVESYDPAKQIANIKPTIKQTVREGDDQDKTLLEHPVIPAVPVVWPRGGGYFMTFPLAAGDSGLLVFSERDLGAWRDSGQVSDAGDEGIHGLAGAVFIPGLEVVSRALSSGDAGTDHMVLGKEGGTQIHVDGSFVHLGGSAGSVLVLATSAFQTWITAVSSFCSLTAPPDYKATKAKAT